jgi:hypothetical protein
MRTPPRASITVLWSDMRIASVSPKTQRPWRVPLNAAADAVE